MAVTTRTVTWKSATGETRSSVKYQADFYDRSGKRHRRLFARKRDAQRWLDEQNAGLLTGQWASPQAGRETVRAYGERWLARQVLADSTLATYTTVVSNHILPTLGSLRMDAVMRDDVQLLVKEWLITAAPSTVHARYLILAIMFRAAVKDRVLPTTPCVDIKLPRLAAKSSLVPISTDMVRAMQAAIAPRYRLFVTLGAGTGMRRGEILGLTLDRIAYDFRTIRVDRQLARTSRFGTPVFGLPKTPSSTRTIPVGDVVMSAVKEHLAAYGRHESGLLFTTEGGNFPGPSTMQGAWQRAARKIGTTATPHDLRHYFASAQIRGGQSIKVLQALLGHKSATETWDTYGHLMGDEDVRSRQIMDEMLGERPALRQVEGGAAGSRIPSDTPFAASETGIRRHP